MPLWSLVAVKGIQQWSWPVCFCAYNIFHFQADFFNWFDQTKERLSWEKLYVMLMLAAALLLRLHLCRYLHKSVLRVLDASWIKGRHCSRHSYVSSDCCGSSCLWSLLHSLLDVFLVFLCGYKRVHLFFFFFFKHRFFCLFAHSLNKTILQLFAHVLNSFLLSLAQERCHPFHTFLHYFFSSVKLLVASLLTWQWLHTEGLT